MKELICKLFGHSYCRVHGFVGYDEYNFPVYEDARGCARCHKTF